MGFKSRSIPSLEVLRVDGEYCHGFTPKQTALSQRVTMPLRMVSSVKPSRQIWEA